MKLNPNIFGDYDIRAVYGQDLDKAGVEKITQALIKIYRPKTVALGRDMRLSGEEIFQTMSETFVNQGVEVIDLGLVTTDMVYFAAGRLQPDLGIMISASHNPAQYNGLKIVKKGAVAVSGDSGIYKIRDLALSDLKLPKSKTLGKIIKKDLYQEWLDFCFSKVDKAGIKPLKIVVDAGNGMGSEIIKRIQNRLPVKIIPLFFDLDGRFPNHVPNPLKPENLQELIKQVKKNQADLGVAFDGDADRISFVDENGRFVSGTITTALLSAIILKKNPQATILYNAVCGRIVPEIIKRLGGKAVRVRVGHTLIKEAMRKYNGLFCGEHSGHYYYQDTFFSESALLTFLYILTLLSGTGKKLSEIIKQYDIYYQSGEINFQVKDKEAVMKKAGQKFAQTADNIDWLDGLSVWFKDFWFNLRPSNTEPLLRLNLEADTKKILTLKLAEIISLLENLSAVKVD